MKNLISIPVFAVLILVACNTKQKQASAAEEAMIRKIDSLVTQMDSIKTDIDSTMKEVDDLIEDL